MTRLVYGNGQSQARDYDADYAIARLRSTQSGGLDIEFATDAVGNLVHLVQGTDGRRLGYDGLNRLTQVTALNDVLLAAYAYDATGNRVQAQTAQGVEDYAYAPDNHRLTAVAGVARAYDAAGNTLERGDGLSFVYDARNRLTEAQRRGRPVQQVEYNARGERVRTHLERIEAGRYLYGEGGQLLVEEKSSGHGKGRKANAFTEVTEIVWLDELPVALVRDGVVYYIDPDHLGSPRAVHDPGRNVAVWTWSLLDDPFGATLPQEDPDGDREDFVFDLRFPGQVYEAETGLHYNYQRDYEPGIGRFLESDPIGLNGGLNTYRYAYADPLRYLDPLGLSSCTTLFCLPSIVQEQLVSSTLTNVSRWRLQNVHVEPVAPPPVPPTRIGGLLPLPIHTGKQIATCLIARTKTYTDLYERSRQQSCLEVCFGGECGGSQPQLRWRTDHSVEATFELVRNEAETADQQIFHYLPHVRCLEIVRDLR